MIREADRFELLRAEFLRIRGGDAEEDADHFVSQLRAIVPELPARAGTTNKDRRRELQQFAAALTRARQYAERMDGLTWLAIDEDAPLKTRSDLLEIIQAVVDKVNSSASRLDTFVLGSRPAIAAQQLLSVFRIFGLPVRDSASSFVMKCAREVLDAMGEEVNEGGIRNLIRRSKLGQK